MWDWPIGMELEDWHEIGRLAWDWLIGQRMTFGGLACYWTATRLPLDCQLSSFLKHKYALNIGKNVDTKGVLLP